MRSQGVALGYPILPRWGAGLCVSGSEDAAERDGSADADGRDGRADAAEPDGNETRPSGTEWLTEKSACVEQRGSTSHRRNELRRPELRHVRRRHDDAQTRTLARVGLATMVMR